MRDIIQLFAQTFAISAGIGCGIVLVRLFVMLMKRLERGPEKAMEILNIKEFIGEGKLINVHMEGGKSVLGVRLLGFASRRTGKDGLPYRLSGMMIVESVKGARSLIQPDSIKMIEEAEE